MTHPHSFHIPVMGVGFTVDTPLKVAHLGISSVMSIGDDLLCERLRAYYSEQEGLDYSPIERTEEDYRARRITAYLSLVHKLVQQKFTAVKELPLEPGNDLYRYYSMLPDDAALKLKMAELDSGALLPQAIKDEMTPGAIEVNVMTKLDRQHYDKEGNPLPTEFNDAHAALRGYAGSTLNDGIVLSAGLNPRLYSYIGHFDQFFPDENSFLDKKVVLKVSDYRSALVQGKFLAKKGIWVSEYRIESGLNCGGHAFATEGILMGPILQEFKEKRADLVTDVHQVLCDSLSSSERPVPSQPLPMKVTVQGGVGNAKEHNFLLNEYGVDAVGWATPFLLVPEAVNVDAETSKILVAAGEEELYLSSISPIGVPFNTVKGNTKDVLKQESIDQGDPGSTCPRQYLKLFNTEFTEQPICLSSKQYQKLKIKELDEQNLSQEEYDKAYHKITEKACLCTGLVVTAYKAYDLVTKPDGEGVAVCPGPNLAYFSNISSLEEMVGHIYGRENLLNDTYRPNMYIKELGMYIDYFNDLNRFAPSNSKEESRRATFIQNLLDGIAYYEQMFQTKFIEQNAIEELASYKTQIEGLVISSVV